MEHATKLIRCHLLETRPYRKLLIHKCNYGFYTEFEKFVTCFSLRMKKKGSYGFSLKKPHQVPHMPCHFKVEVVNHLPIYI